MLKPKLFKGMRLLYLLLDRSIISLFGEKFKQQYVRIAYKIKTRVFPEYGSHIPAHSAVGSSANNLPLIPPAIPDWVLAEMRDLARDIDPILSPNPAFIAACQYYVFPVVPKPGDLYKELISYCKSEHYTHCFAIPWLKKGGADVVTLYHLRFLASQPDTRILVLLTEPGDSPWLNQIPSGVDIVDASKIIGKIAHDHVILVITRLLIQLKIDVLHIINSRHTWEIVCKHGQALRQKTRIFASIFCDDYDENGMPVGFARQYLPQSYQYLNSVFTDNHAFPKLLLNTYGYPTNLFTTLNTPFELSSIREKPKYLRGNRVLWAGRIDRQKRPDLLLAIAKSMPNVDFYVYGDPVLSQKMPIIDRLKRLKNVRMLGGFNGVESLPFHEFPLFLYTSQWDGTPTIIIAAAYSSIPIVTSCVGGIQDIITEESGFPIHDIDDVSLYTQAITYALNHPEDAKSKAKIAYEIVSANHNFANFESVLKATTGYLSLPSTLSPKPPPTWNEIL